MSARAVLVLCLALSGLALWGLARAATPPPPAAPPQFPAQLLVAVYLPGTYFPHDEGKAAQTALGEELAAHLSASLQRPASHKVYATAAAMENDIAHITVALVEAPYIATRLNVLTPLCVAAGAGTGSGRDETRLLVMAGPAVADVAALRGHRLAYAQLGRDEHSFLEHFVFEGALSLSADHLVAARDVATALSMISARKADAILLYQSDAAMGQKLGLRVIYETTPLPRPTLVVFDQNNPDANQVIKLREVMARFAGRVHPQLGAFRPVAADRYEAMFGRVQRKNQHVPPMLTITKGDPPLRLPAPAKSDPPQPPLRAYAPTVP